MSYVTPHLTTPTTGTPSSLFLNPSFGEHKPCGDLRPLLSGALAEPRPFTSFNGGVRRCFSEPRICVGWPSSPSSSCLKVFVHSTPRLPLLWHVASSSPVFPHARRFSQTWPATRLDPPSTRSQPPQRTCSSGMCSSSHTWTTKARTRGTQLDSCRASRRVRGTWSISSGSRTCHSRIGS